MTEDPSVAPAAVPTPPAVGRGVQSDDASSAPALDQSAVESSSAREAATCVALPSEGGSAGPSSHVAPTAAVPHLAPPTASSSRATSPRPTRPTSPSPLASAGIVAAVQVPPQDQRQPSSRRSSTQTSLSGVSANGSTAGASDSWLAQSLSQLPAPVVPPPAIDVDSLLVQLDAEVSRQLRPSTSSSGRGAGGGGGGVTLLRPTPSSSGSSSSRAASRHALSHQLHDRSRIDSLSCDGVPTFVCAWCGAELALQDELISKSFSGRDGKAYLFFSVLNAVQGAREERQLLTGMHTVADLSCRGCGRNVGWTYLKAWEASQKYKEGKFILERAALHKLNNWR